MYPITISHSSFTAPEALSAPPILPPPSTKHWQLLFLLSPWYCLFQNVILESLHVAFQIGFFLSVMYVYIFSMFSHGLIAHFFLALGNIPLSQCVTVYPFT